MNVHPNNDNAIYYLLMFPKITIITVVHLGIYKSVKLMLKLKLMLKIEAKVYKLASTLWSYLASSLIIMLQL